MNSDDKNQLEMENNIIDIISEIIGNIAIYRAMTKLYEEEIEDPRLIQLINNTGIMITIRFCNLFGTDREDNHWKNLFKEEEDFHNEVIIKAFKSEEKYKQYRENIKNFRNNYSVHYKIGDKKIYEKNKILVFPKLTPMKRLLKFF